MNDFTYSVVRSFNAYINGTYGTSASEQLLLNPYPGKINLNDKDDTICVQFPIETIREFGGRYGSGQGAREGNFIVQIDCYSAPNAAGEPRQGANRKLKDKVEQMFKPINRINLYEWDGTNGTTLEGGMFVRQTEAQNMFDPEMPGWSRWRLGYRLRAIDNDT
jgi:hypothetical protein